MKLSSSNEQRLPKLSEVSEDKLQYHFGGIEELELTQASSKSVTLRCPIGHVFKQSAWNFSKAKRLNCPKCRKASKRFLADEAVELEKFWSPNNSKPFSEVLVSEKVKYFWNCKQCGHSWAGYPFNELSKRSHCLNCKQSSESFATVYPSLLKYWNPKSGDPQKVFHKSSRVLVWNCSLGHEFTKSLRNFVKHPECPVCSGRKLLAGFNDLATTDSRLRLFVNEAMSQKVHEASQRDILLNCPYCSKSWSESPKKALKRVYICDCLRPLKTSSLEVKLSEVFKSSKIDYVSNDSQLISPYEVDFYFPKLGLALEVNGDYWHSTELMKRKYGLSPARIHSRKIDLCLKKDVTLAFIWESQLKKDFDSCLKSIKTFLSSGVPTDDLRVIERSPDLGDILYRL